MPRGQRKSRSPQRCGLGWGGRGHSGFLGVLEIVFGDDVRIYIYICDVQGLCGE